MRRSWRFLLHRSDSSCIVYIEIRESNDNVIPDSVKITGTMRSFTAETRQLLQDEMRRACKVVEALGGKVDLNIVQGYPPMINDETATHVAFGALKE